MAGSNRAESAFDLLVNNGHRVQVKSTKRGTSNFDLHRMHWDRQLRARVWRPYRASDFDFLVYVMLPPNDNDAISTWIIPMAQLVKHRLVTSYNEYGVPTPGADAMTVNLNDYPELEQRCKETWHLLQQVAVVVGRPVRVADHV
jgi:hypothetical protein